MKDSRECTIPAEVLSDPNRREVLRAWVAHQELHVSLWIPDEWPEPAHWGVVLSDVMRHVADAYHKSYGIAPEETIRQIQAAVATEVESPTRDTSGGFTELNWVTSQHTYEDFPLFLRRPTNVDTPANRELYPTLATITLEFAKRCTDGRPEPDYNETLFDFDNEIVTSFDSRRLGVPVLVETFGGKRHYYFYVAPNTDVTAIIQPISRRYPNEKLTWETRPDTNWSFLDKYAKDFF